MPLFLKRCQMFGIWMIPVVSFCIVFLFPQPAKQWGEDVFLVSLVSWSISRCLYGTVIPKLSRRWVPMIIVVVSFLVAIMTWTTGEIQALSIDLLAALTMVSVVYPVFAPDLQKMRWLPWMHGFLSARRCFRSSRRSVEWGNAQLDDTDYMDPIASVLNHLSTEEAVDNLLTNCHGEKEMENWQRFAFADGWYTYLESWGHPVGRFLHEPWIILAIWCEIGVVLLLGVLSLLR